MWSGRVEDAASGVVPVLREGDDRVDAEAITVEEHLRAHPARYNQATLLEKMEREGIGTKATRADIISTLMERGYVAGEALVPTELGFSLVEAMRDHCPQIISTGLTRDIEAQLESIEGSDDSGGADFFEEMLSTLVGAARRGETARGEIAGQMGGSVSESVLAKTHSWELPGLQGGEAEGHPLVQVWEEVRGLH